MSHPFIIWTRQRTGGISLFTALSSVSEHPAAENEPFDHDQGKGDRQFTNIGRRLTIPERDRAMLDICNKKWLIKHCYEFFPDEFNLRLAEIATTAGYRHIHRYRHDEIARLISKGIAERYGTWVNSEWNDAACKALEGQRLTIDVPALKDYHKTCVARWVALKPAIQAFDVSLEETTGQQKLMTLSRLARFLNIPQVKVPQIVANMGAPNRANRLYGMIVNRNELVRAIS